MYGTFRSGLPEFDLSDALLPENDRKKDDGEYLFL